MRIGINEENHGVLQRMVEAANDYVAMIYPAEGDPFHPGGPFHACLVEWVGTPSPNVIRVVRWDDGDGERVGFPFDLAVDRFYIV